MGLIHDQKGLTFSGLAIKLLLLKTSLVEVFL